MKSFGRFMLFVAVVLAIMGIVGFYQVNSTGFSGDEIDSLIGLNNMIGSTQYMDSSERFIFWLVQYRTTLMLCAAAAAVVGFFMMNSKSDAQENHKGKPVSETKEELPKDATTPSLIVQKSIIEKPKAESIEALPEDGEVPLWLSIAAVILLIILFIVLK